MKSPALDQVISEMKISGANEQKKLQAVQNFFADKFSYSIWQGPDKWRAPTRRR